MELNEFDQRNPMATCVGIHKVCVVWRLFSIKLETTEGVTLNMRARYFYLTSTQLIMGSTFIE